MDIINYYLYKLVKKNYVNNIYNECIDKCENDKKCENKCTAILFEYYKLLNR